MHTIRSYILNMIVVSFPFILVYKSYRKKIEVSKFDDNFEKINKLLSSCKFSLNKNSLSNFSYASLTILYPCYLILCKLLINDNSKITKESTKCKILDLFILSKDSVDPEIIEHPKFLPTSDSKLKKTDLGASTDSSIPVSSPLLLNPYHDAICILIPYMIDHSDP